MKTSTSLTLLSRSLLIIAGLALAVSIFVPIWRIDLDAPQYPEGLRLLIFADRLGGNVDIINGLNHYIGMKTLHADEFIEFTILPYIIGFYALFSIITAFSGKRKILYILFILFVLFGIVAMVDFWRWEYDYGHNLDPTAAIIVPGMAYQPPLIGFKQLLNFGAYSIPAAGGWLFIGSGVLMLLCVLREKNVFRLPGRKDVKHAATIVTACVLTACVQPDPEPIKLNADNCDYCRMTISNGHFAAELVTQKGRIYKFDDYACMQNYVSENEKAAGGRTFISDFINPGTLIETKAATFIEGENVNSPMGGNMAAFSDKDSAIAYVRKFGAELLSN
jgi:copper chaperone NosL